MPLSSEDYSSIAKHVELEVGRLIGRRRDSIITAKVIKNDIENLLVWVKEIKGQPIPVVGFDYDVTYFDESPRGVSGGCKVYKKKAIVKVKCPKVGELVVIAREMSYDGWPKCLGVVQGIDYIQDLEDI